MKKQAMKTKVNEETKQKIAKLDEAFNKLPEEQQRLFFKLGHKDFLTLDRMLEIGERISFVKGSIFGMIIALAGYLISRLV